ncbi:hypothetical protein AOQ84DRAFT_362845 [Glonium stellatum]|uniref:RAD52 homolog n=1 Tax=Glonium stellatum TaxID=574774 RepID=A0A8E2F3K2_9PEZI|nr:hypothetical protein AOQ84DRAFT_362845 [Glonium stellatum]
MPAPGDQYRSANIQNPFEEKTPRVNEFTAQEIATLQTRLNKQLGPEYISTRPGAGGGKVAYLAAEKAINLANEVFGFNGWSSSIQQVQIDFVDESQSSGKISLGLSIIVRVTLKDGTFHEDIGYGHIENCKGKAAAFEKAKKEAATDALKRALRTFGNVLGNCLYDKDYMGRVKNLKAGPSRWDVENLHRHPDYAPIKKEVVPTASPIKDNKITRVPSEQSNLSTGTEFEDEFGGNLFDGVDLNEDHGDEITIESVSTTETVTEASTMKQADLSSHVPLQNNGLPPQSNSNSMPPRAQQPIPRMQSMPSMRPNGMQQPQQVHQPHHPQQLRPQAQARGPQTPNSNQNARFDAARGRMAPPQQQNETNQLSRPQHQNQQQQNQGSRSNPSSASDAGPPNHPEPQRPDGQRNSPAAGAPIGHELPIGFVTSRAAELLQKSEASNVPLRPNVPAFNPHAESPSLRRTSGIDHMKSAPVSRQAVVGSINQNHPNGANASRPNFINPQTDANRRIGMPGAAQSPLANRSVYKPPGPAIGMKRSPESMTRPPLADVSNIQMDNGAGDGLEAKRTRVGGA